MSTTNNGGPAFPGTQYASGISPTGHAEGMTLRDYFAAKAMQGMLADSEVVASQEQLAEASYKMADAMLRAREPK